MGVQATSSVIRLAIVMASLLWSSSAQQSSLDGHNPAERWTWGRREGSFQPSTEFGRRASQRQYLSPVRTARVVGEQEPRSEGATSFKSITATTFPSPLPAFNLLPVHDQEKSINPSKPPMRPSPVDTTPLINQNFESHFEVIGRQLGAQDQFQSRPEPTIITPGEFPYPFNGKAVDLGDGTSVGGPIPDDTLSIDVSPVSNAHTKGQFKPPKVSDDHDTRYTTLDKLFDSRLPTELPDPRSLTHDVLGGLHPDEVFYADKDLVIIKGGGFHSGNSQNLGGFNDLEREAQNPVRPAPVGNELGEANDPRGTNVRPDEKFSRVPLPLRFVNGNIPVIVSPPSSGHFGTPNRQFRPLHHASFRPLSPETASQVKYATASSQQSETFIYPTSSLQNLDEDYLVAEPSVVSELKVMPPAKRSTDKNVIAYHYQTRGSGSNMHSIVNYSILRPENQNNKQQDQGENQRQNPNIIRKEPVKTVTRPVQPSNGGQSTPISEIEGEDFSVPAGGPLLNLVPDIQTPRQPPTHQPARPIFTQPTVSLEGDTDVNFLPPLPPVNTQAQFLGNQQGAVVPSAVYPSSSSRNVPLTFPETQPARLISTSRGQPISLADDTRVNFVQPLPAINRQAEVIAHHPIVKLPTGESDPRVTRLNPVLTQQLAPGRPTVRRTNASPGQKRFMEPRRRQSTRQRQTPVL
ncbi:uncharacterized protein LOC108682362 [Hyalella azteca]|uniref:Uncharacterized protein LOC108682362 n=1 Tax=Hyalella azteca TaxID=294128 RepID=A0A8B7PLC7_HYAAZ|nr:uncharacterized protein LOC108682362 [Hyalella azteca]